MLAHAVAAAVLAVLACCLGTGASLHCSMRREISPCTCRREDADTGAILVACKRISAYHQVATALSDKFTADTKIELEISHSDLPDIVDYSFRDLGLSVTKLKLNFDNLSELNETVFSKLELVRVFSVADNSLRELPRHVLKQMPHAKTIDISRNKIEKLDEADFKDVPNVEALVVAGNQISKIDRHALPKALKHIHLGINRLSSLNGALRDLDDLEWIFINENILKSLDGELPLNANKLALLHAAHNKLQNLPRDLKSLSSLDCLYLYDNDLKSLDGNLQKSKRLTTVNLSFNKIEKLMADEFIENEMLADLDIGYNQLQVLNGSMRHLRSLRYLNLTHNLLTEFSLQEIKGLKRLSVIDLSHNIIGQLSGDMENVVDVETRVMELRLNHNRLRSLGGALMGLHGLLRLNVSHNLLHQISPDDLIGLDDLRLLDISYNQITTLEETSKTFLPALEELLAHHNNITALDKDFHGLPALCSADLSYNQIRTINYDLVTKTHCSIRGIHSTLKLFLQDNPILCDEHIFDLITLMESLNARINGQSTCISTQTASPVLVRALNDIQPSKDHSGPLPPVIYLAHLGSGLRVLPIENELNQQSQTYPRVGGIVGHIVPDRDGGLPILVDPPVTLPPQTKKVVVKWPDDRKPTSSNQVPKESDGLKTLQLVPGTLRRD